MISCEDQDEFNPSSLSDIISLQIENDNTNADGVSEIIVKAIFPSDFETEEDNKVDFEIFRDSIESVTKDIIFTTINGEDIKLAELSVTNNKEDAVKVTAAIVIAGSRITKEITVTFEKAFPEMINVRSSSLTIKPNSFEEIEITTELKRETGIVSTGFNGETRVVDTLGATRGVFNDYQNITNNEGKIVNKLTLGNDDYTGKLFVISHAQNEMGQQIIDSLTIFSQNIE